MSCRTCAFWGDDHNDIKNGRSLRRCNGIDTIGLDAAELEQSGVTKVAMICGDTSCNAQFDPYLVTPGGFGCSYYASRYKHLEGNELVRDGEYD